MTISFSAETRLGGFAYAADLEAEDELLVLFGHSGAGKSVTLQLTAGLLRPERGRIVLDGKTVFDSEAGVNLPPQERETGYVVQDLALFPHMTVAQNIGFGMRGEKEGRRRRIGALVEQLGLEGMEGRLPRTLSGGQQQRVALARALGREARVLLLDEPFSALDDALRKGLRAELLRLRKEMGLSILFVTHDLREAHLLADRLAVFDRGRVLQVGPREEVFRQPLSRRVAELTGVANIWRGTVVEAAAGHTEVLVEGVRLRAAGGQAGRFGPGDAVDLAVRAERVIVRREGTPAAGLNQMECVLAEGFAYGASHTLRFAAAGTGPGVEVELGSRPYDVLGMRAGPRWTLEVPPEELHLMRAGAAAGETVG